jgi:hypothetical protein
MKKTDASRRSRVTTVLLAAGLLVGGANLGAYAATGHPLILGHKNVAGRTTTLTNHGHGPVLHLKGKRSASPLKVSSSRKVRHLNVDRVDGRSAASLANTVVSFALPTNNSGARVKYTFPTLPPGLWQVSFYVNRTLKANGSKAPQMACSFSPNSTTSGQGTVLSPSGTHATVDSLVVVRTDATASLTCRVNNGTLVAKGLSAGSGAFFLKVDRGFSGTASRTTAEVSH